MVTVQKLDKRSNEELNVQSPYTQQLEGHNEYVNQLQKNDSTNNEDNYSQDIQEVAEEEYISQEMEILSNSLPVAMLSVDIGNVTSCVNKNIIISYI